VVSQVSQVSQVRCVAASWRLKPRLDGRWPRDVRRRGRG